MPWGFPRRGPTSPSASQWHRPGPPRVVWCWDVDAPPRRNSKESGTPSALTVLGSSAPRGAGVGSGNPSQGRARFTGSPSSDSQSGARGVPAPRRRLGVCGKPAECGQREVSSSGLRCVIFTERPVGDAPPPPGLHRPRPPGHRPTGRGVCVPVAWKVSVSFPVPPTCARPRGSVSRSPTGSLCPTTRPPGARAPEGQVPAARGEGARTGAASSPRPAVLGRPVSSGSGSPSLLVGGPRVL